MLLKAGALAAMVTISGRNGHYPRVVTVATVATGGRFFATGHYPRVVTVATVVTAGDLSPAQKGGHLGA